MMIQELKRRINQKILDYEIETGMIWSACKVWDSWLPSKKTMRIMDLNYKEGLS